MIRSFRPPTPRAFPPAGFTLLEVILAIAILATGLLTIAEVVRMSYLNATQASGGLQAQMVAESVMAELKCGVRAIENFGPAAIDRELALGEWMVQVQVEPSITTELVEVQVRVGRTLEVGETPACEVVRWFPNPELVTAAAGTTY